MVQGHRKIFRIMIIRTQEVKDLSTSTNIQSSAISFYQDSLYTPSLPLDPNRLDIFPRLLTNADNMELNQPL